MDVKELESQLQDSQSENAFLREAIADAWRTNGTCQEALTEAQSRVRELTNQNKMLCQYLKEISSAPTKTTCL